MYQSHTMETTELGQQDSDEYGLELETEGDGHDSEVAVEKSPMDTVASKTNANLSEQCCLCIFI